MPLIPALRRQRQRQVDLCEFDTNLIYRASFRTGKAVTQRIPVLNHRKWALRFNIANQEEQTMVL